MSEEHSIAVLLCCLKSDGDAAFVM